MNVIDLNNLLRKIILYGFNIINKIISIVLDRIVKFISFDFLISSIRIQVSLRGVNHCIILPMCCCNCCVELPVLRVVRK